MLPFRCSMISHPFLTHVTSTTNLDLSALLQLRQLCFWEVAHWKMLRKDNKGNFQCELWLWTLWFDIFHRQCTLSVWVLLASYSLTLQPQDLPSSLGGWMGGQRKEGRRNDISVWRLNGQMLSSTKTICLACSLSLCDTAIETPLAWKSMSPEWLLLPSLEPGQRWDWLPDTDEPAEHCQACRSWLADHRPEPRLDIPADWAHRIQ